MSAWSEGKESRFAMMQGCVPVPEIQGRFGERGRKEEWGCVPATSMSLLGAIAGDARHARWAEFVARYRPMMERFLAAQRVPAEDRDDILQDTFVAVVDQLPKYRPCVGERKAFHRYLTGILRNKAADWRRSRGARSRTEERYVAWREVSGGMRMAVDYDAGGEGNGRGGCVWATVEADPGASREEWRRSVCEIALQQLLADEEICRRDREVFRRLWLERESGGTVAEAMGMSRDAVYQVRSRVFKRLKAMVERLLAEEDGVGWAG